MQSAVGSTSLACGRPAAAPRSLAARCLNRAPESGLNSSSRAPPRRQQQQRRTWRAAAEAGGSGGPMLDGAGQPIGDREIGLLGKLGEDFELGDVTDVMKGRAGYTPFDLVEWSEVPLKHEVAVRVQKPVSEVYALWAQRIHWPDWFAFIEEIGFKEGADDACALHLWYRWAMTPWLQLYVAFERTRAEKDKYILEEPADGAPLVAAALFQEDGPGACTVTLRVSYLLPQVLLEFAGAMAVYGDVDRKLRRSMEGMAAAVEAADCAALLATGEEQLAAVRAGLPEHRRQQEEENRRYAAEKAQQQAQARARQERQEAAEAAAAAAPAAEDILADAQAAVAAVEEEAAAAAKADPPAAPKKRGRAAAVSSGKTPRGKAKAAPSQ